jgi:hypothetical protein
MKALRACAAAWLGIGALAQNSLGQENRNGEAGPITYVAGSSQKICQLTGEMDRELGQPTVNQTGTRFGLISADLGYSFETTGSCSSSSVTRNRPHVQPPAQRSQRSTAHRGRQRRDCVHLRCDGRPLSHARFRSRCDRRIQEPRRAERPGAARDHTSHE